MCETKFLTVAIMCGNSYRPVSKIVAFTVYSSMTDLLHADIEQLAMYDYLCLLFSVCFRPYASVRMLP